MKIFFCIAYFYPSQKGGPANSIYWLAKALQNKGVQHTVVATDAGIQKNTIPVDRWIETEAGSVIYKKENNYIFWPKLITESARQVSKSDIIHLTSLFAFPSLMIAILSVLQRKKIVWSPRGELDDQALIYSSWKKKPVLFLVKHFLANTVTFHGTSAEETKHILRTFGTHTRIIEIPNLIELPKLIDRKPGKHGYLLFIGRIHPIKALDHLIQSLSKSHQFLASSFTLLIAGNAEDEYKSVLQRLIDNLNLQNRVKFIGQVEGEAKQLLFAEAYFTILPSHTENFGNVVVESLAQATPVIASTGTPWEILNESKAGYWVDNQVSALSLCIDHIISLKSEEYKAMRWNARQLCESKFDIDKNIDKWIGAYSSVLNG